MNSNCLTKTTSYPLPSGEGVAMFPALPRSKAEQVIVCLNKVAYWRKNSMTGVIEMKVLDSKTAAYLGIPTNKWVAMNDYMANTMIIEMERIDLKINKNTLDKVLNSANTPVYDPVKEYLDSLPNWNGRTDYINMVSDRIKLEDESLREYVRIIFKKWFVRMVRSWIEDGWINDSILFLVSDGRQGVFKTTFINQLLPLELRRYQKCDFDFGAIDKDAKQALSCNLLINADDTGYLSSKDTGRIKSLTSLSQINERLPYDKYPTVMPRRASFAATSNVKHILTDKTGNRRWLTILVKEISPSPDSTKPGGKAFPYSGMYSQALSLIRKGYDCTFSRDELDEIERQNLQFMSDYTYSTNNLKPRTGGSRKAKCPYYA